MKDKIIYWAYVMIADSGMYVKITEDEFSDILTIAKRGYGLSEKYDSEDNLTFYYAEDFEGQKSLVSMKQVVKGGCEND